MTKKTEDDVNTEDLALDTDDNGGKPLEHLIPKSRFDEVNTRMKAAETALSKLQKDQAIEADKRLEEQEKYRELYEKKAEEAKGLGIKAAKLEEYEQTLQNVLDSQLEDLPEDLRSLVPDELSTSQKLSWLARNKAKLVKPGAPEDIGGGNRGGGKPFNTKLSLEEKKVATAFGYSDEDYLKFKQ